MTTTNDTCPNPDCGRELAEVVTYDRADRVVERRVDCPHCVALVHGVDLDDDPQR